MLLRLFFYCAVIFLSVQNCDSVSSPFRPYETYKNFVELADNVADLWWSVDDNEIEIVFELHIKTTGWIALGISPAGGMKGADIGVGWIDRMGKIYFQDRYAVGNAKPILDNTTHDWQGLRGREQDGWTAIQFKRLLDTCDPLDVLIKSGTNNLIFAYGLVDPDPCQPNDDITHHQGRRGSRSLPLRSYANPPPESKFDGLDYFEFRFNQYVVPSAETTYHCQVYKAPNKFSTKRHIIAHKTLIEPANRDLVHHLLLFECDANAQFDDNNLPEGLCDEITNQVTACSTSIATSWAVGGDEIIEFPDIAGYPMGGDFSIKYYMIQMHYDNPKKTANRRDSTGIRFYIGDQMRQYDIGYLTLGTVSGPLGIALPPGVDQFFIDNYCTSNTTKNFPQSGITVFSSFPHTHLQGRSIWTKLIRNQSAVQYLFNAEAFDFNYQYENILPNPIQIYPGDEFATRCVYSTMNRNEITIGGESTKEEMCLQILKYYPRLDNSYICLNMIAHWAWQEIMNDSTPLTDYNKLKGWLQNLTWTSESKIKWQEFYDKSPRIAALSMSQPSFDILPNIPKYADFSNETCTHLRPTTNLTVTANNDFICNGESRLGIFVLFEWISIIMRICFH